MTGLLNSWSKSLPLLASIYRLTKNRETWEDGILAWDYEHQDFVLVIPFISALLGDNPMQSEFACHVGAMGNFFCRICSVSTGPLDAQDCEVDEVDDVPPEEPVLSGATSDASTDGGQRRKKERVETMAEMIDRIKRFVKVWVASSVGSPNATKLTKD